MSIEPSGKKPRNDQLPTEAPKPQSSKNALNFLLSEEDNEKKVDMGNFVQTTFRTPPSTLQPQVSKTSLSYLVSENTEIDTNFYVQSALQEPFFQTSKSDITKPLNSAKKTEFFFNEAKQEVSESESEGSSDIDPDIYKDHLSIQYRLDIDEFTDEQLSIIQAPCYGEKNDFFHQRIDRAIKAAMIASNLEKSQREESEGEEPSFFSNLIDTSSNGSQDSIPTIFSELYAFKQEFPKIFQKRNYESDIMYLKEFVNSHLSLDFKIEDFIPLNFQSALEEVYSVNRSPKDFKGDQLIFGCGHDCEMCDKGPHDPEKFFLVDFASIKPDIEANIYSTKFWNEFNSDSFAGILGEGIAILPWSPLYSQILRILKKDGTFTCEFPRTLACAFDNDDEIKEYFYQLGFSKIEIDRTKEDNGDELRLTK